MYTHAALPLSPSPSLPLPLPLPLSLPLSLSAECQVTIDESVRGKDVFIIQTGSWTKSEDEGGVGK